MRPKKDKTIKFISKLLAEGREAGGEIQATNRILEAILLEMPWDQLLLSLANVAFHNHEKTEHRDRGPWLKRARTLHAAMEAEKAKRLLDKQIKAHT